MGTPTPSGSRAAAVLAILAILLAGLIGGCDNDNAFPPGVLAYVNIDTFSNHDTSPQVASDGTNFLVVYDETVTAANHDVIGAFVNQGGGVLSYVNIETSANDDRIPRVAFDGTNYLVVYQEDNGADHDVMGLFVSPGGAVGAPFAIDNSAGDDLAPAVAFDGTRYLVVYQRAVSGTNGDIVGALVDTAGAVQAGSPFDIDVTASDDRVPAVASNGPEFLVAFQRVVSGTNSDIRGAVVDPTITSTPPTVTPFDVDAAVFDDRAPRVASGGTHYLVAYEEVYPTDRDIRGALVTVAGLTAVSLFGIDAAVDFDDYAPAVAFDGTNYLVSYTETHASTDHDIIGARVDSTGTVLSFGFAIDSSPFDDFSPSVAFGSTSYLVAYEEIFSSADHDIFGAIVTP
jgi:hypothetical protein